ncbi:F-box domain-containing protein [Plasmodiophora brassicae]|nr:hypothetical protein PBRA_009429 [Plasmodiophora brassicae]
MAADDEVYHAEVLDRATMGQIFTYLTIFEMVNVTKVSRDWASIVADETITHTTRLDFSQLWFLLGEMDPAPVVRLLTRYVNVTKISFAYCHHLTDNKLIAILETIPNKANVRQMSLFYCYKLTDQAIRFIARSFPNLEDINIGSLFEITDKSIQGVAQFCRNIRRLTINHNERFTNDILIDFSTMVNLRFIDMQFTKVDKKFVDEHRESFPAVTILGPERQAAPPDTAVRVIRPRPPGS